jgi:hypothetical protein
MYQLVSARYRKDRRAGRWTSADLSTALVTTLTTVYGDVWLYIAYPSLTEPKALRFDKVADMVTNVTPTTTVQQWLTALGNQSLPFEEKVPDTRTRYVTYGHAFHLGYDIQPRPRLGTVQSNLSKFDMEDLNVTHPQFTPEYINDYGLWQVNGLFHNNDYAKDGVRIVDGNTTIRGGNDNQVGVLSFEAVGKIQRIAITPNMVAAQNAEAALKDGVYLTLPPEVDMTNKSVLLVVAGYLHVAGRAYSRVGDRVFKVELQNLMLMERLMQLRPYLEPGLLPLTQYEGNTSLTDVAELHSDACIKALLTLSQTFFVIVDCPTFFHELEPVEYSGLPGRYFNYSKTNAPLMGAYGRALDYHTVQEEAVTVLHTSENLRHHYDANRRKWRTSAAVDNGRYPSNPFRHTHAFLRLMGTEA